MASHPKGVCLVPADAMQGSSLVGSLPIKGRRKKAGNMTSTIMLVQNPQPGILFKTSSETGQLRSRIANLKTFMSAYQGSFNASKEELNSLTECQTVCTICVPVLLSLVVLTHGLVSVLVLLPKKLSELLFRVKNASLRIRVPTVSGSTA